MNIVIKVSDRMESFDEQIKFLDNLRGKLVTLKKNKQTLLMIDTQKALHQLTNNGNPDETHKLLESVENELKTVNDVESCTYSHFYSVKAQYFESKLNFEQFYSNSLQYLAYINEKDLKPVDKVNISVKMAIAALVSKKIYNFGELLEQQVLQSLSGGEFNWIYELLQAYNSGDVGRFDVSFAKYQD